MSGPLLFIIVIAVVDLFLKSLRDKKKVEKRREREDPYNQSTQRQAPNSQREVQTQKRESRAGSTIRELRRSLEGEFDKQIGKVEDKSSKKISRKTNDPNITQTPQERSREAERIRIEKQKSKVDKHSELERSSRLQKARLSDSQVTLGSKDPKRRVDYADLSTRKPISIELEEVLKEGKRSRSRGMLNIREDILKGVIYSEILSKPKSLEKRDR